MVTEFYILQKCASPQFQKFEQFISFHTKTDYDTELGEYYQIIICKPNLIQIYQIHAHFAVEAVQKFGPNVIGFQLATGERRWYIVGCYLAPDDTSTIERVVEALQSRPRGAELLVARDFNVNLATPEGDRRAEDIDTTLATEGLEDTAKNFLPRESRWCWDWRTWGVLRKGREVRSRTDYILGTDRRIFRNAAVRST